MKVLFATGNEHKVVEANAVGKLFSVKFERVECPYPELRSESVSEVAEEGVRFVYAKIGKPVIVEDSGLFIQALDDFPGAYSAYVYGKLGNYGILKLLGDTGNRRAEFASSVAYFDGETLKSFEGRVAGSITPEPRGSSGFGYDPVFMPEGYDKTFAEDTKLKNELSHRRKSFEGFLSWIRGGKRR
ncbi:MAG: XTP/dITP diphosphatase [Candidatus Altiarchaeota archaeon]